MAIDQCSEFMTYLAERASKPGDRLPPIPELAGLLGISTGKLREQLEVARLLGLVEVRPKTGIRSLPYVFGPGVRISLLYALGLDPGLFRKFWLLREHIEVSFWHEAVGMLRGEEIEHLQDLVARARQKLEGRPAQIPHSEHRDLHMTIYSRLNNPFVSGLLEAYWEAYEAVGLNLYNELSYLDRVWEYHGRMVDAIAKGDYDAGYRALIEHADLIHEIPQIPAATDGKPSGITESRQLEVKERSQ
jgi:DNA-binding FadR family transcriptional regulator